MTQDITPSTGLDDFLVGAIPEDLQLQKYDEKDADEMTKAGDWLPRLQVFGSNTELVKEGLATMGVHGLVYSKEKFTELGKELEILALTFRTKALRIPPDGSPISYYNRGSDAFKKVVADSKFPNSGCMYGPEFLVWIPAVAGFATYFFGNPTLRRAAPGLLTIMKVGEDAAGKAIYKPKAALSKITFIKTTKFSWHGAQILPLTTPLADLPAEFAMTVRDEVTKFLNPPESQVEMADTSKDTNRAR